jgi:hypothetical protein
MREDLRKELEKLHSMDPDDAYKYAKSLIDQIGSGTGHPASLAKFSLQLMEAITEYVQSNPDIESDELVKGMLPFLFDAWIIPTLKAAGFNEREVIGFSDELRRAVMVGAFRAFEKFIDKLSTHKKPEKTSEAFQDWLKQRTAGDSGTGEPE